MSSLYSDGAPRCSVCEADYINANRPIGRANFTPGGLDVRCWGYQNDELELVLKLQTYANDDDQLQFSRECYWMNDLAEEIIVCIQYETG